MKYLAIILLLTGCSSSFFKSTQGKLTNVGVSLPNADMASFQIASYLSGQQITVKETSKIKYTWNTSETNSYFGVIKTQTNRNGEIIVDGK